MHRFALFSIYLVTYKSRHKGRRTRASDDGRRVGHVNDRQSLTCAVCVVFDGTFAVCILLVESGGTVVLRFLFLMNPYRNLKNTGVRDTK